LCLILPAAYRYLIHHPSHPSSHPKTGNQTEHSVLTFFAHGEGDGTGVT
jgi:hypothetical protein